jgi:hypothetical protein
MPADAFRDVEVGISRILEEFCQLERHPVSLEQKLLEHGKMQGHHLLKVRLEIVHDGTCVSVLKIRKGTG